MGKLSKIHTPDLKLVSLDMAFLESNCYTVLCMCYIYILKILSDTVLIRTLAAFTEVAVEQSLQSTEYPRVFKMHREL